MSTLQQISFYKNIRNEVPNQELAKKLAETKDQAGIAEIAAALWDKNPSIQSDCLKVMYEVGYLDPELIAVYVPEFLKLAFGKNNRLAWGAMIALSRTAGLNPLPCLQELDALKETILAGSVITQDNGIKTLAALACARPEARADVFPFLIEHLHTCREKDVAQRAESIFAAVDSANQGEFLAVLAERYPALTDAQKKRVDKLTRPLKK